MVNLTPHDRKQENFGIKLNCADDTLISISIIDTPIILKYSIYICLNFNVPVDMAVKYFIIQGVNFHITFYNVTP